jgi:phospholipase C
VEEKRPMKRLPRIALAVLVPTCVLIVALPALVTHGARRNHIPRSVTGPVQHVIFILKENHTFDSYFGRFPGVNGATAGPAMLNGVQTVVPLADAPDAEPTDFCHEWKCAHGALDHGAMDAFNTTATLSREVPMKSGLAASEMCTRSKRSIPRSSWAHGYRPTTKCRCSINLQTKVNSTTQLCSQSAGLPCYVAAEQSDIPNYWQLAQSFVLDDNAWSSLLGPSLPNHLVWQRDLDLQSDIA